MATVGVSSLGRVRLPVILLLPPLAAGCASDKQAAPPATTQPPAATLKPPPAPPPKRSKVHVIVYDGDTGKPVRDAAVHVGRFGGRTDYHGGAKKRVHRHGHAPDKDAN